MAISLRHKLQNVGASKEVKKLILDLRYLKEEDANPGTFYTNSNYLYIVLYEKNLFKVGVTSDYKKRLFNIQQNHIDIGEIEEDYTFLFKLKPPFNMYFLETQLQTVLLENGMSTPRAGDGGAEFFTLDEQDDMVEIIQWILDTGYVTGHRTLTQIGVTI